MPQVFFHLVTTGIFPSCCHRYPSIMLPQVFFHLVTTGILPSCCDRYSSIMLPQEFFHPVALGILPSCCRRYSSIWRWSDNTTALSYNISYCCGTLSPYCAAFHQTLDHLTVIQCDRILDAHFLCEMSADTDQQSESGQGSSISLPVPSHPAFAARGMVECQDHSASRQFLGCDTRSGRRDSPDTPPCPHDRRDLDSLWFQCRDNSGCVPYTLVCDHRQDCADGSDEDFCHFTPCSRAQFACSDDRQVSSSLALR